MEEISVCFYSNGHTQQENEENEEIVFKAAEAFQEESIILKKQNICVYFGLLPEFFMNRYGFLVVKNTDEYTRFNDIYEKVDNGITNIPSNCKNIIYLTSNIRDCKNEMFKIFTISHEFQHVIQKFYLPEIAQSKHSILYNYFKLKEININELPREFDAIKKSKIINYKIFGKNEVNNFITAEIKYYDDKINNKQEIQGSKIRKCYWGKIRSIDVKKSYCLETEINELWERYKCKIENKITTIKNKVPNIRTKEEKYLLSSYMNYLKNYKNITKTL